MAETDIIRDDKAGSTGLVSFVSPLGGECQFEVHHDKQSDTHPVVRIELRNSKGFAGFWMTPEDAQAIAALINQLVPDTKREERLRAMDRKLFGNSRSRLANLQGDQ